MRQTFEWIGAVNHKWAVISGFGSLVLLFILGGCGGGGDGGSPPPRTPPPNLSGIWAGNWSGTDPVAGDVSGNWEAEIAQTDAGVTGTAMISGDVDCSDGVIAGKVGSDNIPRGTFTRTPCEQNDWRLTSFIAGVMGAAGTWGQVTTGATGRLSGKRIAKSDGPRIRFFSPPGAPPGALVTLVGDRLAPNEADNQVSFDGVAANDSFQVAPGAFSFRVPAAAGIGPLSLTTPTGEALSPRTFNGSVSFPGALLSGQYAVGDPQQGIAVSPDGRRVYVATNNATFTDSAVKMLDAASGKLLVSTSLGADPVQGLTVSPDGRWVYACNSNQGIKVLHATTNALVKTLAIPCGDGSRPSPQGIAITPDGSLLLVADSIPGGDMLLVDNVNGQVLDRFSPGPDFVPIAVAASPDDLSAFLLFDSISGPGQLVVYRLADGSLSASLSVGNSPLGLAVTPDAGLVFVSNQADASLTTIDAVTLSPVSTSPVANAPAGLAVSPDGSRLYLAGKGADSLQVLDVVTGQLLVSSPVLGEPQAIAISPDGKNAYLTHTRSHDVAYIGGARRLTMLVQGPGVATSTPAGIFCGTNCRASYDFGSQATLHAIPKKGSAFVSWGGDPDCLDGRVTMDADKICRAEFIEVPPVYGCFIATAAYGSFLEPEVQVLRDFRDHYMLNNAVGRYLNQLYLHWSPPLAAFIQRHELVRGGTRIALTPIVYGAKHPLVTVILLGILGSYLLFRSCSKRRRW